MNIYAGSDVGKVRANNEDNYTYARLEDASFAAVCDGMGGVEGGEKASEIAVQTIRRHIENGYSPQMNAAALDRLLVSALGAANFQIYEYAQANFLAGMGTTAVLALIKNNTLCVAYAGDSRAYIIGNGIRQITEDHTYVNMLYQKGELTKEQMLSDSRKNIITRALGVADNVDVDLVYEELAPGDAVLLCSDGLTNCLSDEEILECFENTPPEQLADKLIALANENGGYDNITVALMLCEEA